MTIEVDATLSAAADNPEEMVRFDFRCAAASGLLQRARAMLDAAPSELAESFEQAVRASGLAA